MSSRRFRRGFTLFQLLLILAILLIVLALLLPALVKARMAALRMQGSNNLKQLGLSIHNCNDTYGKLPPTLGSFPVENGPNMSDGTIHFYLLPFIEQQNVYNKANDGAGRFIVSQGDTAATVIKVFLAPNDPSVSPNHRYEGWLALCNYPANYLAFKRGGSRIPATFTDGTSNTIIFAQRYQMCNGQPHAWGYSGWYTWAPMFAYYSTELFQAAPAVKDCDPERAQALIADGIQVGLADGSVKLLTPKLSAHTWFLACEPNDGFPLGADW